MKNKKRGLNEALRLARNLNEALRIVRPEFNKLYNQFNYPNKIIKVNETMNIREYVEELENLLNIILDAKFVSIKEVK